MPQKWIQTPVSGEVFEEYSQHKKELRQTWTEYILAALALYKQTTGKRAVPRKQKRYKGKGEAAPPQGNLAQDCARPFRHTASEVLQSLEELTKEGNNGHK
jgi:hypothetical protein